MARHAKLMDPNQTQHDLVLIIHRVDYINTSIDSTEP